jgi:hypothetical protein
MPDPYAPSEFGGKMTRNLVQPDVTPTGAKGHEPDVGERLGLYYRSLDETGHSEPDVDLWHGLLRKIEQTKLRENAGDFEHGVELS